MWTGLGAFQDVTVRMVAEHLAHVQHGTTYVPAELVHAVVVGGIPKLTGDKRYHVYTSPHNPGASEYARRGSNPDQPWTSAVL